MRILVTPWLDWQSGPGISVRRVMSQLSKRGVTFGGKYFFKYAGIGSRFFDLAWIINNPRWMGKILKNEKLLVSRMGQFTFKEWCDRMGLEYTSSHKKQREEMVKIVQSSHRVVFISDWVMKNFQEEFYSRKIPWEEDKYDVIYNAVDLGLFCPPVHRNDSVFTIGTSGYIRQRSRLDTLFRVSRMLEFDHKIVICGKLTSFCNDLLKEYFNDRCLRDRTVMLGWIPPQNLNIFYRNIHCLFHPVAGESCSNVIPEALSCGVPVVVPEFGGPAGYLGDGGILVSGDPWDYGERFCERMADAVKKIYENQFQYSRSARNSAELKLDLITATDKWFHNFQLATESRTV